MELGQARQVLGWIFVSIVACFPTSPPLPSELGTHRVGPGHTAVTGPCHSKTWRCGNFTAWKWGGETLCDVSRVTGEAGAVPGLVF